MANNIAEIFSLQGLKVTVITTTEVTITLKAKSRRRDDHRVPLDRRNSPRVKLSVAVEIHLANGARIFAPLAHGDRFCAITDSTHLSRAHKCGSLFYDMTKFRIAIVFTIAAIFLIGLIPFTWVVHSLLRLNSNSATVFSSIEQGEQRLKDSVQIASVTPYFQDATENPYAQYPIYAQSGPTFQIMRLAIGLSLADSGRYKIRVVHINAANGLKSSHETEVELSAGERDVDVYLPAQQANADVGVWFSKMPLGAAEITVYKWTTEKEITGYQLSESEEGKKPAYWEVLRRDFTLHRQSGN